MREQNIEVIRKACIAVNPEIAVAIPLECQCGFGEPFGKHCKCEEYKAREIRLADVLLAIEDNEIYCVLASGEFGEATHEGIRRSYLYWNLRKDSLTEQSDECLAFLANLLK